MSQQHPAIRMEFDRVVAEYSAPVQAAGLPLNVITIHTRESSTPDELRRSLTRALQQSLPRTVSASIRCDASRMPNAEFAKTEQAVQQAVFEVASRGPELRAVIVKDATGREATTFYGPKRGEHGWMEQFAARPALMKRCGNTVY